MNKEDSSTDVSPRSTSISSRSTLDCNSGTQLNTISPLLMQYKYDETLHAYEKVLKILHKKERLLKTTQQENESLKNKYNSLLEEHKKVQLRTEAICLKYLYLQEKKSAEIKKLKNVFAQAVNIIVKKCAWSKISDDEEEEIQFQQFVKSLEALKF